MSQVNSIAWDASGELLLSGSDDRKLMITNAFSGTRMWLHQTEHRCVFALRCSVCANCVDGTTASVGLLLCLVLMVWQLPA